MRIARATAPNYPHFILQRGNCIQTVFEEEKDYRNYLDWLALYAKIFSLKVWAYCLMPNQVSFICVPKKPESLAKAFNSLHMRYSQYFNQKKGVRGHLWQDRFHSCILDDSHVCEAVRYIENNPVRARLVEHPHLYPWSSAAAHVQRQHNSVLNEDVPWSKEIGDWLAFLKSGENESFVHNLLENIKNGRPCGDETFIKKIEDLLGRKLRASPRGRPPKFNLHYAPNPTRTIPR